MSYATTTTGRRARLGRSSMGEPFLSYDEALRLLGPDGDGLDPDDCMWRAATLLVGYEPKGLGLGVAYLRSAA